MGGKGRKLELAVDLVKLSAPSLARAVKQRAELAAAAKQQQIDRERSIDRAPSRKRR